MNCNKTSQRGLAQIPIMIGLLIMAAALPVATKLIQQNQDTRNMAAPVIVNRCYCVDRACTNNCEWSSAGGLFDCTDKSACKGGTPTPNVGTPTLNPNLCSRVTCPRGQVCKLIMNQPVCVPSNSVPTPTNTQAQPCNEDYECSSGWLCKPVLPELPKGTKICMPVNLSPTPGAGCTGVVCPSGQSCIPVLFGGGICIGFTPTPTRIPTPTSPAGCWNNSDCGAGRICVRTSQSVPGTCAVAPTAAPTATPTPRCGATGGLNTYGCGGQVLRGQAAYYGCTNSASIEQQILNGGMTCPTNKLTKLNRNADCSCSLYCADDSGCANGYCYPGGNLNTYGCNGSVISGHPALYACTNAVQLEAQINNGTLKCSGNKKAVLYRSPFCACELRCETDSTCIVPTCAATNPVAPTLLSPASGKEYQVGEVVPLTWNVSGWGKGCPANSNSFILCVSSNQSSCDLYYGDLGTATSYNLRVTSVDNYVTWQVTARNGTKQVSSALGFFRVKAVEKTCSAGIVNTYGCAGSISSSAWSGAGCSNAYPQNASCPAGTLAKLKRNSNCTCEKVCETTSACNACSSAVFNFGCGATISYSTFASKGCANSGSVTCPWYKKAVLTRNTNCYCTTSCVSDMSCQ